MKPRTPRTRPVVHRVEDGAALCGAQTSALDLTALWEATTTCDACRDVLAARRTDPRTAASA